MFSPAIYDASAIDLWSLGAVLTSFFTPIRLVPKHNWEDEDIDSTNSDLDEDGVQTNIPSFILTKRAVESRSTQWARNTLFSTDQGELGYVWSVFKVRGTPSVTSWPVS